jgi:hypothetical protein
MEDAVTIALMARKGWRSVRGGSWCSLELAGMPDLLARAFARAPPKPPIDKEERVIFDHKGQAVALRRTGEEWQARLTGPLAVVHNPASGVVLLSAASQDGARAKAVEWSEVRADEGCGV